MFGIEPEELKDALSNNAKEFIDYNYSKEAD